MLQDPWSVPKIQTMLFTTIFDRFYYQIILVLNLTSMRNLTKRQQAETQEKQINYKQLYLQCKKNVAIFMKQVDTQMSEILKRHECEKKILEDEVERLKGQLKQQNQNSELNYGRASIARTSHKRSNSESYVHTQASVTSVSREAVEECLSKLNSFDYKPKQTPSRKSQQESRIQTNMKSIIQQQKENQVPSVNFNEDIDLSQLKVMNTTFKRDQRFKEKKVYQTGQKAQNIKDFLKDIRGKLSSRQKSNALKEKEEPIISVITPDLFSTRRDKNH